MKLKKSNDEFEEKSVDEEVEDKHSKSSDYQTSSRHSQPSVIQRKIDHQTVKNLDDENIPNDKDQLTTTNINNATNLLSKVMFMDTLGSNTLEKIPSTIAQLNQTVIGGDSVNNAGLSKTGIHKQVNFSNTETRKDLADLEVVYRNLANFTDSGLNSLLKTNTTSNIEEELNLNQNESNFKSTLGNQSTDIMNSEIGLKAIKIVTEGKRLYIFLK